MMEEKPLLAIVDPSDCTIYMPVNSRRSCEWLTFSPFDQIFNNDFMKFDLIEVENEIAIVCEEWWCQSSLKDALELFPCIPIYEVEQLRHVLVTFEI